MAKQKFDEPTHGVRLQLSEEIFTEITMRAAELGLSKRLFSLFCTLRGMDQVAVGLGQQPLAVPPVLQPAQERLGLELVSQREMSTDRPSSPAGMVCWMPVSLYERCQQIAAELEIPVSSLCSWAAVSWVNAMRVMSGQPVFAMPQHLTKYEPKILGIAPTAQSALPLEAEEALLAS